MQTQPEVRRALAASRHVLEHLWQGDSVDRETVTHVLTMIELLEVLPAHYHFSTGQIVDEVGMGKLADEAEAGYDVSGLTARDSKVLLMTAEEAAAFSLDLRQYVVSEYSPGRVRVARHDGHPMPMLAAGLVVMRRHSPVETAAARAAYMWGLKEVLGSEGTPTTPDGLAVAQRPSEGRHGASEDE